MSFRLCFALATATLVSACTSLFSGSEQIPISSEKRYAADNIAFDDTSIPLVTHPLDGRPVKIYSVAFDGTGNIRSASDGPSSKQDTLVAHMSREVANTHYYAGPGNEKSPVARAFDSASGFSSKDVSRRAVQDLFDNIQQTPEAERDADLRIVVFGFSRGAAIARDFMNSVERSWKSKFPDRRTPHFYAVLFDTVPTGQVDNLQLSAPKSLDYMVHFVAQDERRPEFMPYVDGPVEPTQRQPGDLAFAPRRINLVLVPGAHADVGGGYEEGVNSVYQLAADQLLYNMGLIQSNCREITEDPMIDGMHDSRGFIDKLIGATSPVEQPNVRRRWEIIDAAALSPAERSDLDKRLSMLIQARSETGRSSATSVRRQIPLVLSAIRKNDRIELADPVPNYVDGASLQNETDSAGHHISANYLPPMKSKFRVSISDEVWSAMADGKVHTLEYGTTSNRGKLYIYMLFDGKREAQDVVVNHSEEMVREPIPLGCIITKDGNSVANVFTAIIGSDSEDQHQ